jgi:hypothetical protein
MDCNGGHGKLNRSGSVLLRLSKICGVFIVNFHILDLKRFLRNDMAQTDILPVTGVYRCPRIR